MQLAMYHCKSKIKSHIGSQAINRWRQRCLYSAIYLDRLMPVVPKICSSESCYPCPFSPSSTPKKSKRPNLDKMKNMKKAVSFPARPQKNVQGPSQHH
jgi:hypothetical protein